MTTESKRSQRTCPSGRCRDGALLIGIVDADGTVRYLGGAPAVDDDFVEIARQGRAPESRFRFAEPCAEGSCKNWSDNQCGLIGQILVEAGVTSGDSNVLPRCGIRANCVWFAQEGRRACDVCAAVVHTT